MEQIRIKKVIIYNGISFGMINESKYKCEQKEKTIEATWSYDIFTGNMLHMMNIIIEQKLLLLGLGSLQQLWLWWYYEQ